MSVLTIVIAVIGCILIIWLRPLYGLAVFFIFSVYYPYAVGRVALGTIDFSVGRILIMALFAKIFADPFILNGFRFRLLDKLVIALFAAEVVAGLANIPPFRLLEYRAGDFFDMALPYFAVRMIVRTKQDYLLLLQAMLIATAFLVFFACYESLTGTNLLRLGRVLRPPEVRMRFFYRAQTTFRHAIYWGIFSAMVGAVCTSLLAWKKNKLLYMALIGWVFMGAFFSMSSGGLLALMISVSFLLFFRYRRHWKTAVVTIVCMCVMVEILSYRHFYDVIDRFTFNSATSWYRTRLFEVAFFEGGMTDHWLTGYGFDDPGWGPKIDRRQYTDMVNHYLVQLSRYGVVGFVPFMAVIIMALREVFRGFWKLPEQDKWLRWCISASLLGVLAAFNSVSLFGQPMIMLYMLFGLCGAAPTLLTSTSLRVIRDLSSDRYYVLKRHSQTAAI